MDWNIPLWVGQALLALAFGSVGYSHAFGFEAMAARMGMG